METLSVPHRARQAFANRYTSSFGEYNPGGGKGQVRKYLLLAKEEVEQARDSLKVMIELLKL